MSTRFRTPFDDPQDFVALPRLAGLALSPDGSRLVTTVSVINAERNALRPSLWQVDPTGQRPAHRLTRGASGESAPVFAPDGDLLFGAARPDPDAKDQPDDAPSALWRLPAAGGEARLVGTRPGGIGGVAVARDAGTVVVTSMTMPGAVTAEDDGKRRTERKDRKLSAILHEGHPVRFWDRDLGPDQARLLVGGPGVERPDGDGGERDGDAPGEPRIAWRDLTPDPAGALLETAHDITPDGRTVVSEWRIAERAGANRVALVAIDVATGERRVLVDGGGHDWLAPRVSPDGSRVALLRERHSTPTMPVDLRLVVVPVEGGEPVEVAPGWDRWVSELAWTPDGSAVVVTADDHGRAPLFRIELASGAVTRLTGDDGAYTDPVVSPDGRHVYALRSSYDSPPAPVRVDAAVPGQEPVRLSSPAADPELPGRLSEVSATAADGTALRAWLALPHSAAEDAPAPLLLWVHGGPLGSWNSWHWRWNPWVLVARGYAVLLPDPALSTGYGLEFIARGWGTWGDKPYTDLMTITDAAAARPDTDATRTAAMGGSFGGYMANWIAGHTDRFSAIVTHASLWALDQFGPTTDAPFYWRREMTAEQSRRHTPDASAAAISTPVLVIHGDRDFRVPIGEALRLWWELVERHDGEPEDLPHRFLYFPDEGHWILRPQNSVVWYETVIEFLDRHVRGG
ncbi:S9 family peptidase [Pseudonocardia humida]|uniref:S9 family peptidase n=1 Tax=Pseudonocardia humida TaxID=2800819 RepID=A0ABT1A782_9PSEU|nr:prolyl oligopeptidase family serine peptidase [Pseudonocardia humida]MCO1658820.1 S9 family peptidase [Pseudonocardia humida]